jgi:hypothetical protein
LNPDDEGGQFIAKANAVISVVYGLDPNSLSDDEWAQKFQEWIFVKNLEANKFEHSLNKIIDAKFKT